MLHISYSDNMNCNIIILYKIIRIYNTFKIDIMIIIYANNENYITQVSIYLRYEL